MRVVLIGFRGTGKTESGRLLSHLLGHRFYDTDTMVEEEAGTTIHQLFETEGEAGFRVREKEIISALPEGDAVVSTGGGAILDPQNIESLRRGSAVVLLVADTTTIEKRIRDSTRPPLTGLGLREEIRELMTRRGPLYRSASDFCVDTTRKNANETALAIKRMLTEGRITATGRKKALAFMEHSGIPAEEMEDFSSRILSLKENPTMRVYGIAGFPCSHSRSPHLFNSLFSYFGINSWYGRFQDPSLEHILDIARGLDARGLSVTIPFKKEVLSYIDRPDSHSRAIGACNTVLLSGGVAFGFNTDWEGIRGPLEHREGSRAVVLGAGGAAASAVYALVSLNMDVTILNRTVERAEELAERFGCSYGPLHAFDDARPQVVVNATPVGMEPDRRSPLARHQLSPGMTVFDLVYTPPKTPLLKMAKGAGCETISGLEMFVRQARAQFRHFTGIDAPASMIRSVLA